jgi:hypothetical protein
LSGNILLKEASTIIAILLKTYTCGEFVITADMLADYDPYSEAIEVTDDYENNRKIIKLKKSKR